MIKINCDLILGTRLFHPCDLQRQRASGQATWAVQQWDQRKRILDLTSKNPRATLWKFRVLFLFWNIVPVCSHATARSRMTAWMMSALTLAGKRLALSMSISWSPIRWCQYLFKGFGSSFLIQFQPCLALSQESQHMGSVVWMDWIWFRSEAHCVGCASR